MSLVNRSSGWRDRQPPRIAVIAWETGRGLLHDSRSEGCRMRAMPLAGMDAMNSLAFFPKARLVNHWKI